MAQHVQKMHPTRCSLIFREFGASHPDYLDDWNILSNPLMFSFTRIRHIIIIIPIRTIFIQILLSASLSLSFSGVWCIVWHTFEFSIYPRAYIVTFRICVMSHSQLTPNNFDFGSLEVLCLITFYAPTIRYSVQCKYNNVHTDASVGSSNVGRCG